MDFCVTVLRLVNVRFTGLITVLLVHKVNMFLSCNLDTESSSILPLSSNVQGHIQLWQTQTDTVVHSSNVGKDGCDLLLCQ